ncbi:hypothetical protein V8F06_007009 [Rhypophila decipiens]
MKLNLAIVTAVALQTTAVVAGDVLKITNINFPNGWRAIGAWNRGNDNDVRPVYASDITRYSPYTPWADIDVFSIDWYNGRGWTHTVAGGYHCFRKRSDFDIVAGVSQLSTWTTADCDWNFWQG